MDKEKALELARQYKEVVAEHLPVKALYLYGSYSKGNFTEESDIDIAVIVSKRSDNFFKDAPLLWKLGRNVKLKSLLLYNLGTMKTTLFFLFLLLSQFCFGADLHSSSAVGSVDGFSAGSAQSIIPKPLEIQERQGVYSLGSNPSYYIKAGSSEVGSGEVESLSAYLEKSLPSFTPASKPSKAGIMIQIQPLSLKNQSKEAYIMEISPRQIKIEASSEAGAFYALQSLLQLSLHGELEEIECCRITDSPRFGYRGLHFDVSRHFRSKEFLLKQMDAMALLKLNKMHLHLTDAAGWRLQIDEYPRLTEFAAYRPYREWKLWAKDPQYCESSDPNAYGGYYSKEDIRELLAYARGRHIEIIPEIEMPGHSEEVLAAYPELSCGGEAHGSSDLCPGKEQTFVFLEKVLEEVIELFPSKYIHIGGDEASKTAWKTCPDCQRRMQANGLEDVDELQSYLIHRIESFVNSKGRQIIGWDEILEGSNSKVTTFSSTCPKDSSIFSQKDVSMHPSRRDNDRRSPSPSNIGCRGLRGEEQRWTIMSWRGTEGGMQAIKQGYDVIMSPGTYCYLDYTQDAPFKEPESIGGYTPLRKTYSYEPMEAHIAPEQQKHLLGIQGNLWSEYITEDSHAEYMYYPRAFAIAETAWSTPENKDYENFRLRSIELCKLLQDMGYNTFNLESEYGERKESLQPVEHLAKGCKVLYNNNYSKQYPAAGDSTLTDGLCGGWTYGDGRWQGFLSDADLILDLGEAKTVNYVGATFMNSAGAWVHIPQRIDVYLSEDGEHFELIGSSYRDISNEHDFIFFRNYFVLCNSAKARYIRIHALKAERPGAWIFTDEIIVL